MLINLARIGKQFLLACTLLLHCGCASANSDKYTGFPEPVQDFSAHIDAMRVYLERTQMTQRTPADVDFNLPFELQADETVQYRGKFLLIHGLNDSPYVFSDVAPQLVKRGFDVRAILLPGHGNSPEAQLSMSYERWVSAAQAHLVHFNAANDAPVYLGGFSLGGVIATLLALENDNVKGLLLFSPAYKSSMNHLLRWSSLYSKFKPWVFGGMIIEDNPTKYNSIPINGAAQYYKTIKRLARKWRKRTLSMPVLVAASVNDSVLDIDFIKQKFLRGFTSTKRKLILYSADDETSDSTFVEYRTSDFPQLRVLTQSHQGVLISPENPLFGVDGSVLVCNGNDWPTFSACLYSDEPHWFGAQHTPSPDGLPVARTTFNPDFNYLFEQFDAVFLDSGQ